MKQKKARTIPEPARCMLWGRYVGRCEFEGRNRPVSYHPRTKDTVSMAGDIITNLQAALTSFQEIANGLEE